MIPGHVPRWDDPPQDDPTVPDVVYPAPRPPGSFVVSGPLSGQSDGGPGSPARLRARTLTDRRFRSAAAAARWARTRYARVVADVSPPGLRIWCLVVVPR